MKFFRVEQTVEKKIVGKYPAFETGYFPVKIDDPKLILNIHYEKITGREVYVPVPKLRKGAKLIDFFEGPTRHEIVSDKLKQLIMETKPFGMEFIPQNIIKDNQEIGGYWLTNNYDFDFQVLDFEKTEICIMKSVWDIDYTVKVKNKEEFLMLIENISFPKRIKIFTPFFIEDYFRDFFALRHVYSGFSFFCSERFRIRLESENITGIRYMELDEVL